MKMLIHTFSPNDSRELGIELIPMGIEGMSVNHPDEAKKLLSQNPDVTIVLTETAESEYLEALKAINPKIQLFLLVHNDLKPADLIALTRTGIRAIIHYTENFAAMSDEVIRNILSLNIRSQERRFHIRIQPREFEQIKAAVFIKNLKKFVRGDVVDISAGGIALKLHDSLEASLLQPGSVYDPLLISFQGMDIKTMATLIAKRNNAAGFKFDNVEPKDMRKISSYIHTRITETSRNLMNDAVNPG